MINSSLGEKWEDSFTFCNFSVPPILCLMAVRVGRAGYRIPREAVTAPGSLCPKGDRQVTEPALSEPLWCPQLRDSGTGPWSQGEGRGKTQDFSSTPST